MAFTQAEKEENYKRATKRALQEMAFAQKEFEWFEEQIGHILYDPTNSRDHPSKHFYFDHYMELCHDENGDMIVHWWLENIRDGIPVKAIKIQRDIVKTVYPNRVELSGEGFTAPSVIWREGYGPVLNYWEPDPRDEYGIDEDDYK